VRRWLTVMLALILSAEARAMAPMPLPAFALTTLDGQATESSQLPRPGRWVLLYVTPDSLASKAALGVFKKRQGPRADRVVVVVGAPVDAAGKLAAGCPDLAQASWFADPAGDAYRRLGFGGVPTVVGARGERLEWKLDGTLPDAALRSALASWLSTPAAPSPAVP